MKIVERAGNPVAAVAVAAVAVAVAVLAAATITFTVSLVGQGRTQQAREDARAVAEQSVPALLSYDHTTLAGEVDQRLDLLGGRFRDDYAMLLRDVVVPTAEQGRLVTTAAVVQTGAVDGASPDRVTLLMFLDQRTGAADQEPTDSGSRVRVTMERDGDRWLVTEMTPV